MCTTICWCFYTHFRRLLYRVKGNIAQHMDEVKSHMASTLDIVDSYKVAVSKIISDVLATKSRKQTSRVTNFSWKSSISIYVQAFNHVGCSMLTNLFFNLMHTFSNRVHISSSKFYGSFVPLQTYNVRFSLCNPID